MKIKNVSIYIIPFLISYIVTYMLIGGRPITSFLVSLAGGIILMIVPKGMNDENDSIFGLNHLGDGKISIINCWKAPIYFLLLYLCFIKGCLPLIIIITVVMGLIFMFGYLISKGY